MHPRIDHLGAPARAPIRRASLSSATIRLLLAASLLWPSLSAQAQTPSNVYDYSRSSAFEYDDEGLLVVERVEPDRADLCVKTTHTRDAWGNQTGVLTQPCTGASATAKFVDRGSTSVYGAHSVVISARTGTGTATVTVHIPAGQYATQASNALGHTEERTYDPRFGVALSLKGPNGLSTQWSVDDFGRVLRETRADGTALATEHCILSGRGLDTSSNTAGCGSTAALSGQTDEIPAQALSYVQTTPLDAKGAVMGPRSRVYTDRAGRTLRELAEVALNHDAQPASRRWTVRDTGYSATGVVQWRTQPYFLGTGSSTTGSQDHGLDVTTVDALGRVVRIDTADPAGSLQATQHGYTRRWARTSIEHSGLSTTTTGPQGHTRREEKNADGRVVRITDATGAQLAHQHDAFGLLVQTQDALQNLVRMGYDIRGRKTRVEDPDTGLWTYEYNALGELVRQQSPHQRASAQASQQYTTVAYDALGRVTQRVLPEYTATWYHDRDAQGQACGKSVGQICQVVTSHGITKRLSYDSLGRPTASRTDISGGPSLASAQAYDSTTGRLSSQTWPTGLQVSYQYTARGALSSVSLAQAATLQPLPPRLGAPAPASITLPARTVLWQAGSVNAWGQAQSQTHASLTATGSTGPGTAIRTSHDPATGRVTALGAGPGNTTAHTSVDLAYAWDSLGQLTGRIDALGDGLTGAVTETYQYDALQRLNGYTVAAPEIPQLQRTVTLSYNAIGNLLHKSDVGNYSYPAYGNSTGTSAGTSRPRPHAVSQISGSTWGTVSYSYDANGNLTGSSSGNGKTGAGGRARSITYTSFNLPDSQGGIAGPGNLPRSTWHYDERQQRIRHTLATVQGTRTTWYLHPDNQGGLGFETESYDTGSTAGSTSGSTTSSATSSAPGTPQHRHYITAGGQTLVLITSGTLPTLTSTQLAPKAATSVTVVQWQAWIRDPQGTVIATLDQHGAVTARLAYDPFGQRRHASGQYDAFGTLVVQWAATHAAGPERGYTGHEHLDDFGLIHMNGRLYEPATGRFLQPDPFIQDPLSLQNFNRYSYCLNSPTTCTDPSGYFFKWLVRKALRLSYETSILKLLGVSYQDFKILASIAVSFYLPGSQLLAGFGPMSQAAIAGFTSGAVASGGDFEAALKGAFTATAFAGVGDLITGTGHFAGTGGIESKVAQISLHGVTGCVTSAASGGKCGPGALSAAFSKAATVYGLTLPREAGAISSAIIGGTASVIGGGKFANGAVTAAAGYLFNECMHTRMCGAEGGYDVQDSIDARLATPGADAIEGVYPEAALLPARGAVGLFQKVASWFRRDQIEWPPNNGFAGEPQSVTLQPGAVIDRYGASNGVFASPAGTSFGARSLPAQAASRQLTTYEVVQPVQVQAGRAASWFGQPGGGTQYLMPRPISELIKDGVLRVK